MSNIQQTKSILILLDPDYKDFKPGKTSLKWKTLIATTENFGLVLALGVLFSCMLAFFAAQYIPDSTIANDLAVRGKHTEAQVTHCQMESYSKYDDAPRVAYQYTVHNERYTAQRQVHNTNLTCADYPRDMRIEIVYLPETPAVSQLVINEAVNARFDQVVFCGLAVLGGLALIGWFFSVDNVWRALKWRRLSKYAVLLDGTLVYATHVTAPKEPAHWLLRYRFQTPAGNWLEKDKQWNDADAKHSIPPKVGMRVLVLYIDDKTFMAL